MRCAAQIRTARTVEDAIAVFLQHYSTENADSDAAAFYGGSGDDEVMDMLSDAGWTIAWAEADYYFVARDLDGHDLTYIEGDIYRGDRR